MVRKAQTYSMDLIIGSVIFMLLVIVFLALLLVNRAQETDLRAQADLIFAGLDRDGLPDGIKIFEGNQLNPTNIETLFSSDYEEVKRELGLIDDFCIVFVDSSGGLISFEIDGNRTYSYGHPAIQVTDNMQCGDKFPT